MMVVHRKPRAPLPATSAARSVEAFDIEQFVRELD
jgi:hypothetical protein